MLDIRYIKENKEAVIEAVKNKQLGGTVDVEGLLTDYDKYLELLRKVESHRSLRNELSKDISKVAKDKRDSLMKEARDVKEELSRWEKELTFLKETIDSLLIWVPNVPADDVPLGEDESGNIQVSKYGVIPDFSYSPKDHLEIGESLGIIDTKRGAKVGGSRAYFLLGKGMQFEQALLKYSLDFMIKQGFTPMNVPVMVNSEFLEGTGYFPWGKDDHFYTQNGQVLAGTAEVSLTSYYSGEIIDYSALPIKMVGQSPCFRREVGGYGKDTRGVFRVHYFNKVEQVVLLPEGEALSRDWHEKMLGYSEQILKDLCLPYRVILMCTGDMGPGQRKKYDVETWFPSQKCYKETHSDSYFLDFQARRLNIRYRDKDGSLKYVNTLNNTVAATPRLLAAVLENYQREDGTVVVPEVLVPYTGFEVIDRN